MGGYSGAEGRVARSTGRLIVHPPSTVYPQRMLVVWRPFHPDAELKVLKRLLAPGWHHVLAWLDYGNAWVAVDPLSNVTEISLHRNVTLDGLVEIYADFATAMLVGPVPAPADRPRPWAPFTCVETIKAILGVRTPFVVTPRQLYTHMERHMGFMKPKTPDTSKQEKMAEEQHQMAKERAERERQQMEEQKRLQDEQAARLRQQEEEARKKAEEEKRKSDARMRAMRAGQGMGRSLLVGATETGVAGGKAEKLGGKAPGQK